MPACRIGAIFVFVALAACTIYGPKNAVEDMARAKLGKLHLDVFRDSKVFSGCYERAGEYGCMEIDITDCRIWYKVDRSSGLVVGWEYAGPREKCWTFHGA